MCKKSLWIIVLFTMVHNFYLSAHSFSAKDFSLSDQDKKNIFDEAENWIDNMPEGLQDRLSDAVNHAERGFYNEIQYIRNLKDTTDLWKYPVEIKDIKATDNLNLNLRLYKPVEKKEGKDNKDNVSLPLLIYFHAGGWSLGSIDTGDRFCRALVSAGNINVIALDYPLSPENKYPKAVSESVKCVEYIFSKAQDWGCDLSKISLGGDGAGGNIALQTYYDLPDSLKISSLVLYYPILKTSGTLNPESKREFGRGFGFDSRLRDAFLEAYKGEDAKKNKPLPPTLLISAGRDIVIDDQRVFAKEEDVIYVEMEGALHGFLTNHFQQTAFTKSVEFTYRFLTSQ